LKAAWQLLILINNLIIIIIIMFLYKLVSETQVWGYLIALNILTNDILKTTNRDQNQSPYTIFKRQ